MNLQSIVDALSDEGKRARSQYHLTLGQLIDILEKLSDNTPVQFDENLGVPGDVCSYRGYYSDLCLEPTHEFTVTAAKLLLMLQNTIGKTLEGYKGGRFLMEKNTPIWCDHYGCAENVAVVDASYENGVLTLITKELPR